MNVIIIRILTNESTQNVQIKHGVLPVSVPPHKGPEAPNHRHRVL